MTQPAHDPLANTAQAIEHLLDALLAPAPEPGEEARPARLLAAMRHAMLGGGKRLRPMLLAETARLFGRADEGVLLAGAAVECIHGYSLVHDDLPAMDNDDLRRGRPTVHKAFDEATAILAGDALQTLAFDILAREAVDADPARRIALVLCLARAAGLGGMAGGQMLDLAAEGRFEAAPRPLDVPEIRQLQAMKTGALLAASVEMGAILGGADAAQRTALLSFGRALGAAFQIADDILDVEGDAQTLGKAAGKDSALGKGTLVDRLGLDAAKTERDRLAGAAQAALAPFGDRAQTLRLLADFVAQRKN